MNIVYIASSAIPSRSANSIHVMRMCGAMAKNGHRVTLLVPARSSRRSGESEKAVFEYYGIEPSFNIRRVYWLPVKGQGIAYGILAARVARKLRPHFVYTRHSKAAYFAAMMDLRVVLESHAPIRAAGLIPHMLFSKLIRNPQFVGLVVITKALSDYYLARYRRLNQPVLVAQDAAAPVSLGDQLERSISESTRFQVGYIGHLYRGKGTEIIVELAQLCPWADFHVIGGTESDIYRIRRRTGGLNNLKVHGYREPKEVPKYQLAFSVLLAPYQNRVSVSGGGNVANWMSPLKLFEYMAARKAIICSDLPVLREVVEHERNALLCPPDDVSAWAQCVKRLYDDADLRARLAETAYTDFLKHYTWEARAARVLSLVSD